MLRTQLLMTLCVVVGLCFPLGAGETRPVSPPGAPPAAVPGGTPSADSNSENISAKDASADDLNSPAAYDDVVHELMRQLLEGGTNPADAPDDKLLNDSKIKIKREHRETSEEREQREQVTAQDAARKLASLGKRSVPALTQLLRASIDKPATTKGAVKATYYSVWALARIRTSDASRALLPLLANTGARTELRYMAVEAAGWEKNADGIHALQKVALADPDLEMRKKAFSQLTMIPEFWQNSEPIFLKGLSDPDGEIRTLAAKACHFSHIFVSANDTLVELLERDPVPAVRTFAMLTLGRMKYKPAQPALMRVIENQGTDEKMRKVALNALSLISEIPFTKSDSAVAWWKREGAAKLVEAEKRENAVREKLKALEESEQREKHEGALKVRAEAAEKKSFADTGAMPPLFPANPDAPKPLMLARKPEPLESAAPVALDPVVPATPPEPPAPLVQSAPPALSAPQKRAELLSDDPPVRVPATTAPSAGRVRGVDAQKSDAVRKAPEPRADANDSNDAARNRQRKSE